MASETTYVPAGERIFIPMRGGPSEHDKVLWDPIVAEPCENDSGGYWYCDNCRESLAHNLAMVSHLEKPGNRDSDGHTHRLVWLCHEHGPETVHPK